MSNVQSKIRLESQQTTQLSQEALTAFAATNRDRSFPIFNP
ncbi:hypothetical protein [Nostoc sp.]